MDYSIIAPAYNEEGNVEPLTQRIAEAMDPLGVTYEIIIIDDGSTDGTLAKLRELQNRFSQLVVISLAENSGQSISMQAGFDLALGERIITMDSDLEKDPKFIPAMIEKLDQNNLDLVYFRKLYQNIPWKRKFASRVANIFRTAFTGDKASDVGSTFIVYRENFFKGRNFGSGFHRYFIGFCESEGLCMDYVEGPVYQRPSGVTKYTNIGRLQEGLADLFYYLLYKNRKSNAPKVAFVVGALALGAGWHQLPGSLRCAFAISAIILGTLLFAVTVHCVHLLVRQSRKPYRIRGVWRAEDAGNEAD